jgi:uncharacterized repeat protein (TIGR02543 family)
MLAASIAVAQAQSPVWPAYGHDAQHTAISASPSEPLNAIKWQTPVDLDPQYTGNDLLIHYGSPLVTAGNNVIIPVKTGATDGFRLDVRNGADGSSLYSLTTDYTSPPHSWIPSFGPVLTAANRLYWAGAGGTVYYRDTPDSLSGATGQIAFYGNANYQASPAAFNAAVMISTPIAADHSGNIFFGFTVIGNNPSNLSNGLARIDTSGAGTYITAPAAAGGDPTITRIAQNCAPGLSNDEQTLYVAAAGGNQGVGYLVALNSATLAPVARVRLKDVVNGNDAFISEDSTASPTIGTDGDVYYGVLENPVTSNHARGWLLHFDATLSASKTPGAFGWDDTASLVPAGAVPSYHGPSAYLLMTKYNNYVEGGGDGVNKLAILDPNTAIIDPISGASVMEEVLTIAAPTPDPDNVAAHPDAVKEWCINSAAIDPLRRVALANNEDGNLYVWDLTTNTLSQSITLTAGTGEAYTPTLIGADGTVYGINNATLFAVGNLTTAYFLTMNAGNGGTVNPVSGWYSPGQLVAITAVAGPGYTFSGWSGTGAGSYTGTTNATTITMNGNVTETANFTLTGDRGLQFREMTPCRIIDTRSPSGPFGGPYVAAGTTRMISMPASLCGIPPGALAYSLNVTVVPRTGSLGFLTLWPSGQPRPLASTLNSPDGSVLANAAIIPAGTGGSINVFATNDTELIIDIDGYFAAPSPGSLQFYALPPCRVLDTRGPAGTFGGPAIPGGGSRSFPIAGSPCGAPAGATAYSLNVTVVPQGGLGFLTAWPSGQPQPLASTLNSADGAIVANAAIVPAGNGGAVSFYASNTTDLVVDINGYFAPPGAGGLNYFAVPPCRVADTRNANGALGGPMLSATTPRSFPLASGPCGLVPASAAYSLNVTVAPPGPLGFLSIWPTGLAQPLVSTLNDLKGLARANMALVGAGTSSAVDVYATQTTDLVLDATGYFK